MDNLDSDLLRTFLAVSESGSLTGGAIRIHRSQSAVSLQVQRLEEIIGQPLFCRHGRGVTLTNTGERLQRIAYDVVQSLDSAYRELTSDDLRGRLRVGIPEEERDILCRIVCEFAETHPAVELEVVSDSSAQFPKALEKNTLDIAVYESEHPSNAVEILRAEKTHWMTSLHHDLLSRNTLPVALFSDDCWWRQTALDALEASGRRYRVAYSSTSVAGVAAAIDAGIAVGLLGQSSQSENMRTVGADQGFGNAPTSKLVLASSSTTHDVVIESMKNAIRKAFC